MNARPKKKDALLLADRVGDHFKNAVGVQVDHHRVSIELAGCPQRADQPSVSSPRGAPVSGSTAKAQGSQWHVRGREVCGRG